ncbi:peptidylprolyl isomerase [Chroococcidiopsis sp. CCALA 051]|uniref:peptidylprolyl isomerase n=1 Tax=Chroococcidiopsis sp. CCALA 051 TaxID=869949 RepID=UPI000D0DDCD9|nr:peptidylprolyl isomerase [Chroococcidiopsis sp. CCALA 051]PSM47177.1 peptidylprolyl isomerase [Chroococcidiopsis sp. CCALA 051]
MTQIFQVGNRIITALEITPLLTRYQMLPQLWRELIIDTAITPIELTLSQQDQALEQFNLKHQLTTPAERSAWGMRYGMTPEQLDALAIRELKIEFFKIATWEHRLESYFLTHKSKLDRVIYSLLRTDNAEIAQELYFRIKAGEQSFALLAREYSLGPEAQTGGLIGPVELSTPHPVLAKMLSISQPGQLYPPTRLGEWFVILRLEKLLPASLDESMRQQLLDSLFEAWIQEQLNQISATWLKDTSAMVAV